MLPILSGFAALFLSLFLGARLLLADQPVLALSAMVGGACTLALLKTLGEIADHLAALREAGTG